MQSGVVSELDFIEELRMRRWARENYVPPMRREKNWHPIIHDEMTRKDLDGVEPDTAHLATIVRC